VQLTDNLDVSRYEYATAVAERLLANSHAKVVFDVGAGDCLMREPLEARSFIWHGFDIVPRGTADSWDLTQRCPLESAAPSLVLLLDVIEHLANPGAALDQIAAVMGAGTAILITTPNPRWSRSRLWALRTGYPICFTKSDLDDNGHIFPVWPHVLERMLLDRGFKIAEYVTLDGRAVWPGARYSLRYPLRCALAAAMMTIERHDRSACGMSYGVVAIRT
jgi:hypothetical protein